MATATKPTFTEWLTAMDRIVEAKTGLSYEDLEDRPFRDWYDDGVSPASAATRTIRYSRGGN